ncbi:hypothetical protein [Caproiciproducens galactitolivorans]|uniref:Spo0E like sporulation regulatory protein n=1 Tax=Caproiciproducens galactitolivorans TaxID=642589 RepID=A0ABT4BTC8_9FIRM|nr:hypothetical protein [Caproiciproducens galactitolivorans]MCY1714157.1 hypothetical protein [Caproiciproducens galactitolivorans]
MKNTEKEIKTLEDVISTMQEIKDNMLWDKVCENNRKINLLNEKLDMIIEKLGGK